MVRAGQGWASIVLVLLLVSMAEASTSPRSPAWLPAVQAVARADRRSPTGTDDEPADAATLANLPAAEWSALRRKAAAGEEGIAGLRAHALPDGVFALQEFAVGGAAIAPAATHGHFDSLRRTLQANASGGGGENGRRHDADVRTCVAIRRTFFCVHARE